ncbi:MAG: hypothetical protein L0Z71_08045, partial [Anaerolineae bacterium]|nr:hypothetical protein [Anaerolineae bacterium]
MFQIRKFVRIVFSIIMIVPISFSLSGPQVASAQVNDPKIIDAMQATTSDCPPYDPAFLHDKSFLKSLPPECAILYKKSAQNVDLTVGRQNVVPMAVGGPDTFGYTYDDSVTYSWIYAYTNSFLTADDGFTGPIDIGFNFPFYGIPQSQLYFSTNGLITFGAGSWEWDNTNIPNGLSPNNMIAAFWDDLLVGSPYNAGAIYYSQGGSAPNRYFVVEWQDVTTFSNTSSVFSFEAILYENGDIVVQHKSLPSSYYATVGIENSLGDNGLQYAQSSSLSAPKAIRFYYPTTPTARLLVSPSLQGTFAPISGHTDFTITISNTGSMGADTYDLSASSTWPITLYASNGVTALTDTDADSVIDTGPVPQGTSTNVIARFSTPGGSQIGDDNTGTITVTSSLDVSKTKTIYLFMSIPAGFASVFQDQADGAMSFMTVNSAGASTHIATADGYSGFNVAVAKLSNENYMYVWNRGNFNGGQVVIDIAYTVLGPDGSILLPATNLTNNIGATMSTRDYLPSVAVAPNGTVGVTWYRYLYNSSTFQYNYNIYFATLDASGNLLTGPTNITNNVAWGGSGDLNVSSFQYPTIAATDDNRFILGWRDRKYVSVGTYQDNIWYAVRNTAGVNVFSPTALTSNNVSSSPVLNSLTGGKVIMTWTLTDESGPYYAVINSNGTIFKAATCIGSCTSTIYSPPDAVQLPNGKVAIAWPTLTGVRFSILNSSYNLQGGSAASTPTGQAGDLLSVTTDASSHVIMTWSGASYQNLFYALGDSSGTFITSPLYYKTSENIIETSWNGQGNAPYSSNALPTFTISGNVGAAGVTLSYSDVTPKSVTSSANGSYSLTVSYNWSGTVTPSHPCFTFNPNSRSYNNVTTNQTDPNYTATFNSASGCTEIDVRIAGNDMGNYGLLPGNSLRESYPGVDNGPAKVVSTNGITPILAAMRVIWKEPGYRSSYSEMMGLPAEQLSTEYWFPWYNNAVPSSMDQGFRIANVDSADANIKVMVGSTELDSFTLGAGASVRKSYNVDNGPIRIFSTNNKNIL